MASCGSCGRTVPDDAKFCQECGAPLAAPRRALASERRVVTVLFCDLIGFTSRSELLDPEDVRAFLVPYYDLVVAEVERHGGVVDKFTGDGAMVVFGVPSAHEDDPERAIRMGLRLLELVPELGLDLHVRVGVNTGEVLFAVEAYGQGDAITGDAANTAKRIEGLAPTDGIVVGERTWQATRDVFEYEELEPAAAKGKAERLRAFRVLAPKARFGLDLIRTRGTPFVGREAELSLLRGCFDNVLSSSSPRLVTVVGEPGLGKSRLVAELFASLAELPDELITWRQGRCLPYGDGITFWPLGEIVKAHAGILDTDPIDVAEQKLAEVLPHGDQGAWLHQRLRPLLGIEASAPDQEALFTAWTRFLEHLASQGPAVLVFEDLHWADEAMLAFLEHAAEHVEGVPLLLLGTARPEFADRHTNFGDGLDSFTRIDLAPLTDEDTGRLIAGLLDAVMVPAEVHRPILERAGGNPLFAEEFVRLLRDRNSIERRGASWTLTGDGELPLPESVHSLIAARLDLLPADDKAMLADAAVVGKVFWAGAVAHMGDRDLAVVQQTLAQLAARELLRPAQRSSIEGEIEYAFWHALVRDVAYRQLPRSERAARHAAAAGWIEQTVGERADELAGVLAHHYSTALELARAACDDALAAELEAPAINYLVLAGTRAQRLDPAAAYNHLERALELAPQGHPDRGRVLFVFADAIAEVGSITDVISTLEEALEAFQASGDRLGAARARAEIAAWQRDLAAAEEADTEVLSLVEPLGPSPDLIQALRDLTYDAMLDGRPEEAIALADRTLEVAEALGIPPPPGSIGSRGWARCFLGDADGLIDLQEALALARTAGDADREIASYNNLAAWLHFYEGPAAALEAVDAGRVKATSYGFRQVLLGGIVPNAILALIDLGELDRALSMLPEAVRDSEAMEHERYVLRLRSIESWIHALRGEAVPWVDWLETTARRHDTSEFTVVGLGGASLLRMELGQHEAAVSLLEEIDASAGLRTDADYREDFVIRLPVFVRAAMRLGQPALAARLVDGCEFRTPRSEHAMVAVGAALAESRGESERAAAAYADAAKRWDGFGMVVEQAFALLGEGRCRLLLARPAEAAEALDRARVVFAKIGAGPALAETEGLLDQATARTA